MNTLYYGDNLDILQRYIADESVDLVYLDPPFNSNANYNVLFAEKDGSQAASQIQAFSDTWTWNQDSERAYKALGSVGDKVADCVQAFYKFLGPCDILAYLVMMAPRLVELRRVMKPTASIYLHCDPTASHYLKMLMDAVFGGASFRNEIVWCYTGPGSPGQRQFSRKHDVILWYAKSSQWTFNADAVRVPHSDKTKENYRGGLQGSGFLAGDGDAKRELHAKGKIPEDYWNFAIAPRGKEYLGYPTQKPRALLERIVQASSNPGDLVLDPFCGCGTALDAAQGLGRQWIGIDVTYLAVNLMKKRLHDRHGLQAPAGKVKGDYAVIGEPTSVPDAEALAASDPYQFQWWALGLVGARPVEQKKGADKGIDGKIVFLGDKPGEFETIILSVKAGHTMRAHVHELRGVVEREKAAMGVLITMQEPTGPMREDAVTAGFWHSGVWNKDYPKIQLLTVAELLDGRQIEMPPQREVSHTFKKAPKAKAAQTHQQPGLFDQSPEAEPDTGNPP